MKPGIQCRVWCAIYEQRPSVCREVLPSGQGGVANSWCDRARAIWGLPPFKPVPIGGQWRYQFRGATPPVAEEEHGDIVASFWPVDQ